MRRIGVGTVSYFSRATLLVLAALLLPRCTDDGGDPPMEPGGAGGGGTAGDAGASTGGTTAGTTSFAGSPDGGAAAGAAGENGGGHAGEGAGTGGASGSGGTLGGGGAVGGAGESGSGEGGNGGATDAGSAHCQVADGEYCQTYRQCPWYEGCVNQRCVPIAEGTACTTDDNCGMAQYCDTSNDCKNRPILDENCDDPEIPKGICPFGSDCYWMDSHHAGDYEYRCVDTSQNTGFCDFGVIPCRSDHYCPTDVSSTAPWPVCVKRGELGESCINEEPGSCMPGLSCNFYHCQPAEAPIGTPCSGYVAGWNSRFFREFDSSFPPVCARGLFCTGTGEFTEHGEPIEECAPLVPIGESCTEGMCDKGYCGAGQLCMAPVEGSQCGVRQDDSGVFHRDFCPAGMACATQGLQQVCLRQLEVGDECGTSPSRCPEGTQCLLDLPANRYACTRVALPHEDCSDAVCWGGGFCVADEP